MRYIWMAAAIAAALMLGWTFGDSSMLAALGGFLGETFSDSRTTAAVASAVFALLALAVQLWVLAV